MRLWLRLRQVSSWFRVSLTPVSVSESPADFRVPYGRRRDSATVPGEPNSGRVRRREVWLQDQLCEHNYRGCFSVLVVLCMLKYMYAYWQPQVCDAYVCTGLTSDITLCRKRYTKCFCKRMLWPATTVKSVWQFSIYYSYLPWFFHSDAVKTR